MKKKLVVFVAQFPTRTETFIEREIAKLDALGNLDITVVSWEKGSGSVSPNIAQKVVYRRITLKLCLFAFYRFLVLHPIKAVHLHKLIMGVDKVPYLISLKKSSDPRSKLSIFGRFHNSRLLHFFKGVAMAELFRAYNPQHLHIHFLSDASTVGMIAAKCLDVPFSISAHARDVFVDGTLIPSKVKAAKFITVCNSNSWRGVVAIADRAGARGTVEMLFHGVDDKKLNQVQPAVVAKKPFFFTQGRLVEKKGLNYLLEASKLLLTRGVDHYIKIIGFGPLLQDLEAQIKTLGLLSTVEIYGDPKGLPNEDIISYMKAADIFIMPFIKGSDGDVDGVPTVAIEAALVKVPVIATDTGSMADLYTAETGWMIDQKDPVGIADRIQEVLANKQKAQEKCQKAFDNAKQLFDIDRNIKDLENLILK